MSAPFQVGDVVIKVEKGGSLPVGTVDRIIQVGPAARGYDTKRISQTMKLADHAPAFDMEWFGTSTWRKIVPASKEFTASIRALKPVKEPA